MDEKRFVDYLTELAQKDSIAEDWKVCLEEGAVRVHCTKGDFRFVYRFDESEKEGDVPLFHWRSKRRYVELKNLLENKMVENPLAMRIHHIVPQDSFAHSLNDLITFESDLLEFITGQKIERVFADFSDQIYTNCIFSTEKNIKASLELGFSPQGSEPVLLHEIVARSGIVSDVAVDTQTQQYPIYVFKGPQVEHYTDIDQELYGLDNTAADCIRFILAVLAKPESIPGLREQRTHLQHVCKAAQKASTELSYTKVEG